MKNKKLRDFVSKVSNNKKVLLSVFIIYLITCFILVINHEIWVDESQSWQMAKELSILELFKQMKFEGHSCLWHLILMPFVKLGFPPITMNFISFIVTSISVYIILFHSKFNIIVKIAIIFNPVYIYYLSVFSRCYSLIPLCLSLFAVFYPKRREHPFIYTNILGVLAHTHIMMCSFVGIAALFFLIEYIKEWKKISKKEFVSIIIIFGIYFILLAIQVIPALDNCAILGMSNPSSLKFYSSLYQVSNFFHPIFIFNIFQYFICIIFLIFFILTFISNKKLGIILFFFIVFFFLIHMSWPWILPMRTAVIFSVFISLNFNNKSILIKIMIVLLSLSIIYQNFSLVLYDFNYDYSDSKNMAEYINKNVEDNSLIVFLNSDRHVSTIPYIKKDIVYYNFKLDAYQTYITWSKKNYGSLKYNDVLSRLKKLSSKYQNIYIMISVASEIDMNNKDKKVINNLILNGKLHYRYSTSTSKIIPNELFTFYKYK